jgi:hypothetical protein
MVPPVFPAELLLDELVLLDALDEELDELDELPHAASANAANTTAAAHNGRWYFLMRPPPRGCRAEFT